MVTGCVEQLPDSPSACASAVTPIPAVQGNGPVSPLAGSEVTIRGIITGTDPGKGFYMQAARPDPSSPNSHGIFVSSKEADIQAASKQDIMVTGTVAELGEGENSMTALVDITSHHVCGSVETLPAVEAGLPMGRVRREALEAMRVSFRQPLFITDNYRLNKGDLTLSESSVLRIPTEISEPGHAARQTAQNNLERSIPARLDERDRRPLPHGASTARVSGLMGHDGGDLRLLLDAGIATTLPEAALLAAPAADTLRIVGMNLQNYFNGDGVGGGFPTERGQSSHRGFLAQTGRIIAAIDAMQPHLMGVMELENDGFGLHSAAASLLQALNAGEADDWTVVKTESNKVGGDVISVGLLYRSSVLQAEGVATLLDGPEFTGLSRQPMAQVFREKSSGARLLIVVNHLKSKGRCPDVGDDADQGDGQGCWNQARVAAAREMTAWAKDLAEAAGTDRILIIGDMNAWRKEDPASVFSNAGFVDLAGEHGPRHSYSFVYFGAAGTLDYAFASKVLAGEVNAVQTWHINAAWPPYMPLDLPWLRYSDHDPVIVDLSLSQAVTSD